MPEPEGVDTRRRVLQIVATYPGLHLREIQRHLGAHTHLAEYHLNALERIGLVTSQEEGGYRCFFPARSKAMTLDAAQRRWLVLLRQPIPLGVSLILLDHGTLPHKEIATLVPVSKGTLTYHLKKMEKAGLVARDAGRGVRLAAPEGVLALLRAHPPTPDLVAAWGDMWTDIFGVFSRERDE